MEIQQGHTDTNPHGLGMTKHWALSGSVVEASDAASQAGSSVVCGRLRDPATSKLDHKRVSDCLVLQQAAKIGQLLFHLRYSSCGKE